MIDKIVQVVSLLSKFDNPSNNVFITEGLYFKYLFQAINLNLHISLISYKR